MSCKIPNFQFKGLKLNEKPNNIGIMFDNDCSMKVNGDPNNDLNIDQSGEIIMISLRSPQTSSSQPQNPKQDDMFFKNEEKNSLICNAEYSYEATVGFKNEFVLNNIFNNNIDLSNTPIKRDINNKQQFEIQSNGKTSIFKNRNQYPDFYTSTVCFKPNNCPSGQYEDKLNNYQKGPIDQPICVREIEPGELCDKNNKLYLSERSDPNVKTKCLYSAESIEI